MIQRVVNKLPRGVIQPKLSNQGKYLLGLELPETDRNASACSYLESRRNYSVSRKTDSALIIAGLGVAVCAATAQYALEFVNKRQEKKAGGEASTSAGASSDDKAAAKDRASTEAGGATKEESPFSFTSTWFARSYYDGGFEDKMTKREAALILGIRESASTDRIKEAYRKLLPLNHPDRGGSAYVATKINEAKDLLLKGK